MLFEKNTFKTPKLNAIVSNPVFKIRNLDCAYLPGQPVLRLKNLDVPAGQLVFIIGKSGVGKSTFIETLGLMNETISPNEATSVLFAPPSSSQEIELRDCWKLKNEQISALRKQHFSFIFQNTNLMPNFTSGENMIVSLLIKGRPFENAKREVLEVMDRLSLSRDIFDKKTTEISGGQRQRLAFVRAITADFTVLFGDEPTGNLDRNTSEELMSILKTLIRDKGKTGIIVSHDLFLAEKFADLIAPITSEWNAETERSFGDILPENILRRNESGAWAMPDGQIVPNTAQYLNRFLTGNTEN
jgi:ABC-type lipoprotein export system ATPase subunit